MNYTPYLISNFATGLNNRLQPWLNADEAQQELFDGFVYRGTLSKRPGYQYFAIGGKGGQPYTESRIIGTATTVNMTGVLNGSNKTFTLAGNPQIQRGSVIVHSGTPSQTLTDNGTGLIGTLTGNGTGTVNYITGAISVTFTTAPTVTQPTVTYSFMADSPVMMVAQYITATNIKRMIVADELYINIFNFNTNTLQDITPYPFTFTGGPFDFFTWTNYPDANDAPRLLFCNNVDPIYLYNGTAVIPYVYTLTGVATLTCSFMVQFKDRLILLRTTENGTVFPQRIRISGTGANSDVFDITATGAGFIDIPDGTWIKGADFNRDSLIIFTENATWSMKYTGNDTVPFVIDRIDESRGSQATFAVITYLNRTTAASPRGLIISDGYRVEREDDNIPNFSFDDIDAENFELCFAGTVDADRDHYLIYPTTSEEASKRILVTNYDEDNFCLYRLPLSCMGTFFEAYDVTWNDLLYDPVARTGYENWTTFGDAFGDWNHFAYSKGNPISIGGGAHGEIWQLNINEIEDNPVPIYNIVVTGQREITVTTAFQNYSSQEVDPAMGADFIFLAGIVGMTQVNGRQFAVTSVPNPNTIVLNTAEDTSLYSAYVSGGEAIRVIPFNALTKKFNPYVDGDKKVRCGWLYMYVDSAGTDLLTQIPIGNITNANPAVVTTLANHGLQSGAQVSFSGVGGMTEVNGMSYFITVLTNTTFSLNGVDSTAFGAYIAGGDAAVAVPAKLNIQIIVNDNEQSTQVSPGQPVPYEGNCTNLVFETGIKKWYKVFINQTGRFIQFRLLNQQAGSTINIQAMMPGFAPCGRLL